MFDSSLEMAELENESPFDAEKWFLLPIISQKMVDDSIGKFGFASQLRLLVSALDKSFEAQYLEDFVSAENLGSDVVNASSSIPPLTVIDRILKELFHSDSNYMDPGSKSSHSIKGAPLDSLFVQFCMHSLWIENCNIRAISALWIEFVREVRWCWEESQPLPKMPVSSSIELSNCLLHQKLQMLAMCIEKKGLLNDDHQNGVESEAIVSSGGKMGLLDQSNDMLAKETSGNRRSVAQHDSPGNSVSSCACQDHKTQTSYVQPANHQRSGSAGIVESMMLLRTFQNMHVPVIQDTPPMTEDMHEERLHVAEALEFPWSTRERY
ncbi:hypothetical protein HPP92_012001 [Vanilla planifolia]|uniref:Rab3 GTPase-activating protein catalytic subunit n=1 Tax=Vanilla planifolia TaxID=51239 RepID=A0A835R776_VANPL|nr:hypothetical protein HPP92_012001 [Vanilla planifolia]